MCFLVEFGASVFIIDGSEPRPVHFSMQPRLGINFFEKGQENWDFYVVKKEAFQGSGSNFFEGPGLGSRSIFKARDRPGINFFRSQPISSVHSYTYLLFLDIYLFSVYSLIYLIQTIS